MADDIPPSLECDECARIWDQVRFFDQIMAGNYGVHVHSTPYAVADTSYGHCDAHGRQPVVLEECCECAFQEFIEGKLAPRYRSAVASERARRATILARSTATDVDPRADDLMAFVYYGVDDSASAAASPGVFADVHRLVRTLPTQALRTQMLNVVRDRSESGRDPTGARIEIPLGSSAPISGIPGGWINPHSFEWLWGLKRNRPQMTEAAEEFARQFVAIPGVIAPAGPEQLARCRHDRLFVVPTRAVSQLSAIESRAVLTRDGFGRYASSADSIVFVSHRWDGRREPDPTGMQLKCLKSLAAWLDAIGHADAALWYDYWSLPQPPLDEPERGELLRSLQQIPDLLKSYAFFRCPGALELYSHATRAWCLLETGLANAVVIPADDNVGAMLATWLWSTPANRRAGLVVAWEEIWAAELAGVGGFDDLRLLGWIGLAERRGDPMTDKASLARQVLDDLATNPLPSELRSLLMRCTVASDVDLVLDLWRTAAH